MPLTAPQSLPSASSDAATLARQLLRLVGPGWQAPDGSNNAADALARGATLADSRQMLLDTALESFASLATDLLSEWEALLGVAADDTLPDADRRARLAAYARSQLGGSPQAIAAAVEAITTACTVEETTAAECAAALATARDVFRFAVVVPVGFVQIASKTASVRAIVDRMKPAHTTYTVANAVGFYCDGYADSYLDTTALDR